MKPQTNPGKWSFGLAVILMALAAILIILTSDGQSKGDQLSDNLYLAVFGVSAAVCSLGAFFAGIFAIIRSKERSLFIYFTTLVGLLVLVLILSQFINPL